MQCRDVHETGAGNVRRTENNGLRQSDVERDTHLLAERLEIFDDVIVERNPVDLTFGDDLGLVVTGNGDAIGTVDSR